MTLHSKNAFQTDRRSILKAAGVAFGALVASGCRLESVANPGGIAGASYGPLVPDPQGLVDLPQGFAYRIVSKLGDAMDDGGTVPDNADGMGSFLLPSGAIALVRNHELKVKHDPGGRLAAGFDRNAQGDVLPGGTTTLVLDPATLAVTKQFRSFAGTIRNCAGGITPWGSWLTCEEDVTKAGAGVSQDHGWVFEVPAGATTQVNPAPLKAMGRFNHEAACVDPATGHVYLTEDRDDGLLYRFVPHRPGKLDAGGKLQALGHAGDPRHDSRNWPASGAVTKIGEWLPVRWIDLDDVESPMDDLRQRGAAAGAVLFARGEGIHMGEGELYFCCTSGGAKGLGQIFRLRTSKSGTDAVQLFFESTAEDQFNFGDNLTIAPNGHLIVCEDQYTEVVDNHLRGITREGFAYPLARLRRQTEWAGTCFSPDGRTLFVNAYSPAMTLAIQGPWMA